MYMYLCVPQEIVTVLTETNYHRSYIIRIYILFLFVKCFAIFIYGNITHF